MNASEIQLVRQDGKVWTTSLDVAERFGKRHADVLRAIQTLDCSPEFAERNFALSEYTDSTGRTLPMYRITRDGFAFLVMGFTGKEAAAWKELFLQAFNAMEYRLIEVEQDDRLFMRRILDRQTQISEQLAANHVMLTGSVAEVRDEVREFKNEVGGQIADIHQRVVSLETRRRRDVSATDRATHMRVLQRRGGKCPYCETAATEWEIDHFHTVSVAGFEHTWVLCRPCHSLLTTNRVKRTEAHAAFNAYQDFARRVLPMQYDLLSAPKAKA